MRTPILVSIVGAVVACSSHPSKATMDGPGTGGDANGNGDGSGSGSGDGGGNPTTITVTVANHPNTAATFSYIAAYEDGAGAWQAAPAPTNDTYTFTVSASAWGFAWTCVTASAARREVNVYYFTVAEATSLTIAVPERCTDRTPTRVALNGTITNPTVGGSMIVGFGGDRATASTGATSDSYALMPLPATHDLLVGHSAATAVNGDVVTDSAFVQRGLAVSGATTTANADYSNAQATQTATVTVSTSAGQTATVSTTLFSAGGTVYTMVTQTRPASPTSTGLASALSAPGDVYVQEIQVAQTGAIAIQQSWGTNVANQTWGDPPALGGATSTVPTRSPYPRIATSWAAYASAIGYDWNATQALTGAACGAGGGTCTVIWSSTVSPGAAGTSPSAEMPNLSAVAGWNTELQIQTGTNVTGTVRAATSTRGAADFPVVDPDAAGTTRTLVSSTWTATP